MHVQRSGHPYSSFSLCKMRLEGASGKRYEAQRPSAERAEGFGMSWAAVVYPCKTLSYS